MLMVLWDWEKFVYHRRLPKAAEYCIVEPQALLWHDLLLMTALMLRPILCLKILEICFLKKYIIMRLALLNYVTKSQDWLYVSLVCYFAPIPAIGILRFGNLEFSLYSLTEKTFSESENVLSQIQ
jgi:hypothetical protein